MSSLPVVTSPAPMRLVAGRQLSVAASTAATVDPQTMIARWLDSKSPTARRTYARALARFSAWAIGPEAAPHDGMQVLVQAGAGPAHSMVEGWRDELLASNLAPGSVAAMVTGLSSLVRCCRRAGLCSFVLEGVAPAAERRQDRSGPRIGDMQRLLATIDDAAADGHLQAVRDACLVRLLFSCGLRRAEAVGLRLEDVDLQAEAPAVKPRRKGFRERSTTSVSTGTAAALQRWLDVRGTEPGPLFYSLHGGDSAVHLSGESVRRMLRSWASKAGIRAAVRPHGCRHSGATLVASRGSLAQLVAYGAWRSLSAASRYLDRHAEERQGALAITDL